VSGDRVHVLIWRVDCPHRSLLGAYAEVRMALDLAGIAPDEVELRDEHSNVACDLRKTEQPWPASSIGLECWLVYHKRPSARAAKRILKTIHGVAFGYCGGMVA